MCRVNPRNASAWSLPALTMPLVRQGNSGEYFANTRSCWAASWLTRMMLVSFSARNVRVVLENPVTSSNSLFSFSSRPLSVLPVVTELRSVVAMSGNTSE